MPDLTAPPTPDLSAAPPPGRWLPDLVARLGPPETSPDDRERWTWHDGDVGVFIDKLTHAWQVVAWTPVRSVTVRSTTRPADADIGRMVTLTGLCDLQALRTARFTSPDAKLPLDTSWVKTTELHR